MLNLLSKIIALVSWRLYDGRGYPLSEIMGWVLGVGLGAFSTGYGNEWYEWFYGAGAGAIIIWTIIKGYDGWDEYKAMFIRSTPSLLLIPWCIVWQTFNTWTIALVVLCFAANITEVPIRRWQHRTEAKWSAHIAEAWEAVWIGITFYVLSSTYKMEELWIN